MKEKTKKRLERIKGIMELADKKHLEVTIEMHLHSNQDPEAVKQTKQILRGMKKEFDCCDSIEWLRFHDGKGAQDYIASGFWINVFCPRRTR